MEVPAGPLTLFRAFIQAPRRIYTEMVQTTLQPVLLENFKKGLGWPMTYLLDS